MNANPKHSQEEFKELLFSKLEKFSGEITNDEDKRERRKLLSLLKDHREKTKKPSSDPIEKVPEQHRTPPRRTHSQKNGGLFSPSQKKLFSSKLAHTKSITVSPKDDHTEEGDTSKDQPTSSLTRTTSIPRILKTMAPSSLRRSRSLSIGKEKSQTHTSTPSLESERTSLSKSNHLEEKKASQPTPPPIKPKLLRTPSLKDTRKMVSSPPLKKRNTPLTPYPPAFFSHKTPTN